MEKGCNNINGAMLNRRNGTSICGWNSREWLKGKQVLADATLCVRMHGV
jgi:hypothetical protein